MNHLVRDEDNGYDDLLKDLEFDARIEVGVFGEEARIAAYQELGTRHNPPSSFIASTVDSNEKAIKRKLESLGKTVINGNGNKDHAREIGQWIAELIKDKIHELDLIDTGKLLDSITSESEIKNG